MPGRKQQRNLAIEKVLLSAPGFRVDYSNLPTPDPLSMSTEIEASFPQELLRVAVQNYHYFRTNFDRVSPHLGGRLTLWLAWVQQGALQGTL
jgi:hypothetical protein